MIKTTAVQYAEALYLALKPAREPRAVKSRALNLIKILRKHNQLGLIDEIVEEFTRLAEVRQGIVHVGITTARVLDDDTRGALKEWGRKKAAGILNMTPRKIMLEESIDENLIGGARVTIGDVEYDSSLRGQLTALREKLAGEIKY